MQFNAYKTNRYPVLQVLNALHKQGKLSEAQARFMASRKPEEELYDLQTDPHELRSLAGETQHTGTLHELRRRLGKWIDETGDQGQQAEELQEVAYWVKRQAERHKTFMRRKGLPVDASAEEHLAYWEKEMLHKSG